MYPLTFLFRLFLGTLFYAFPAFTYAASFQAFQRSRQKIFQIAMSIPDFSDDEWEELSSSYQTLINNIVYEARVNAVPSPEFNYSLVADSDFDTDKEFFFFFQIYWKKHSWLHPEVNHRHARNQLADSK